MTTVATEAVRGTCCGPYSVRRPKLTIPHNTLVLTCWRRPILWIHSEGPGPSRHSPAQPALPGRGLRFRFWVKPLLEVISPKPMTDSFQDIWRGVFILSGLSVWMCWTWVTHLKWVSAYIPKVGDTDKIEQSLEKSPLKVEEIHFSHFPLQDSLHLSCRAAELWLICICLHSYLYFPTGLPQTPCRHTASLSQTSFSVQTSTAPNIYPQLTQKQSLMLLFQPGPPQPPPLLEHLTWFHTSSHQQSQAEIQSLCLWAIIQNNSVKEQLPPLICLQFLSLCLQRHWNLPSLCVLESLLHFRLMQGLYTWGNSQSYPTKTTDPLQWRTSTQSFSILNVLWR